MSEFGFRMEEETNTRKRRALPWVVGGLLLSLIVALGVGSLVRSVAPTADYQGHGTGTVTVEIADGASLSQIAEALLKADVIANTAPFIAAATAQGSSISPGRYTLRKRMEPEAAYLLMLSPESRPGSRLVIKEGERLKEIVEDAADVSGIPASEFRAALTRPEAIGLSPAAGGNPEGWLFPATYDVAPNATATSLLRQMTARFDKAAAALDLEAGAKALGRTPEEVVTVASILEVEVAPQDYAKAARVIYNRLDDGKKLQLDSTVNYALGTEKVRLSAQDLAVDSPYNTYQVSGLPPGPLNSPGEAALDAALNPAQGDWMYFVTTDLDKRLTEFAVTYDEFLVLKKKFQENNP